MNNENPLFSNKFINTTKPVLNSQSKVNEYRNHFEKQKANLQKQTIINKANIYIVPPSSNDIAIKQNYLGTSSKSNKFKGTFREAPTSYLNNSTQDQTNVIISEKVNVISIDTTDRDTTSYPNANDFIWNFDKEYTNVKKIELISTQIPNSDQTIKNTPVQLANNVLSWINQEDSYLNIFTGINMETTVLGTVDILVSNTFTVGSFVDIIIFNSISGIFNLILDGTHQALVVSNNILRIRYVNGISQQGTCSINLGYPVYTVSLVPGNYTAQTLVTQMQTSLNLVKRKNGLGQYHYYNVVLNNDTNVISFESVITKQLPNNPLSTTANSTTITVTSLNHGFHTGDNVLMINVLNTAGISGTILSGDFIVSVIDFNTFQYEVNVSANVTTNGGGINVETGTDAPFKFLFQTSNTKIQYNIGFYDEDSSAYINSVDPITTKVLGITDAVLTTYQGIPAINLTTPISHNLSSCTILTIISISNTFPVVVTTSTPHLLQLPQIITVTNTNSIPNLNGDLYVTPTGDFTFEINERTVSIVGNIGTIFYGGDQIQINGLLTVPPLNTIFDFYILNVPSLNQIVIPFNASQIDLESLSSSFIGTSQVTITQPNHLFNRLTNISAIDNNFTLITTQIPNTFVGSYTNNVLVIDGPVTTNTVDITLKNHNLKTSDKIKIVNSNTNPVIDGTYNINIIDINSFRINFVHSSFVSGYATVITGDTITLTNTNSIPVIDGVYQVNNKVNISSVSNSGSVTTITTTTTTNWLVGDTITYINGTNTNSILDGTYTIQSISGNQITINTMMFSVSTCVTDILVNNTSMSIQTNNINTTVSFNSVSNSNLLTTLTTNVLTNWNVNDVISITNNPDIVGTWNIYAISGTSLTINTGTTFTPTSNVGNISNLSLNSYSITKTGTYGSLQRDQNVTLYRVLGDTLNGSTLGGMVISSINGISFPIINIIDKNSYILRMPKVYATKNTTSGGSGVYVSSKVTGWRSIQANTVTGNSNDNSLLARAINLAGEYYILLVSPTLNYNGTFKVSSSVDNVLAKINLVQSPGLMNYDGFDTSPTIFDPSLSKLPYMHFQMVNRDGYLFNFKDLNYSFSLRIVEEQRQLTKTKENTRTY
jgi:hypothetical protein